MDGLLRDIEDFIERQNSVVLVPEILRPSSAAELRKLETETERKLHPEVRQLHLRGIYAASWSVSEEGIEAAGGFDSATIHPCRPRVTTPPASPTRFTPPVQTPRHHTPRP